MTRLIESLRTLVEKFPGGYEEWAAKNETQPLDEIQTKMDATKLDDNKPSVEHEEKASEAITQIPVSAPVH